jgi:hypothetical protein
LQTRRVVGQVDCFRRVGMTTMRDDGGVTRFCGCSSRRRDYVEEGSFPVTG